LKLAELVVNCVIVPAVALHVTPWPQDAGVVVAEKTCVPPEESVTVAGLTVTVHACTAGIKSSENRDITAPSSVRSSFVSPLVNRDGVGP
jgi:hypothetical protein